MNQGGKSPDRTEAELIVLLREGMQLQKTGRLREAEERYRRALDLRPGNPQTLHLLGLLTQQIGKNEAAEEFFLDAIANDDCEPVYHVSLGVLLTRTGRQREAIEYFERALALAPDNIQARYQLAKALYRLGDLDDALKAYEKASDLDPDNAGLLVNMGSTLNALGEPDKAIKLYRQAIRLDPSQPAAYGNLGNALAMKKRYEEAIAALDRCIELQPENPTFRANLGSCYLQRGDWKRAQSAYQDCLARAPGDITALAMQAAIYNELGDTSACAEILDYKNLLDVQPIDPPDRYGSIEAFNRELERRVLSHPSLEYEPGSHTTRMGQQTGSLLTGGEEGFGVLEAIIRLRIGHYLDSHQMSSGAGWWRPLPRHWRLDMWATVLHQGGHQIPHIHPSGWLSGVYYVTCPFEQSGPDRHGWIEFGGPPSEFPVREAGPDENGRTKRGVAGLVPILFLSPNHPFRGRQSAYQYRF